MLVSNVPVFANLSKRGVVMRAMSSSTKLVRRLRFVGPFPSALLLISIACSPYAVGTGGGAIMTRGDGLSGAPGMNQETRDYFNHRAHFNVPNSDVAVQFKSAAGMINIVVRPENSVHTRSLTEALTLKNAQGRLAARIANVENKDVPELGLTKNDSYSYIWVGRLTSMATTKGISFYIFDTNGNATRKGSLDLDSIYKCNDSFGTRPSVRPIKPADHDPNDCDDVPAFRAQAGPSRAAGQLTSYAPKLARALAAGGLWISCSGGCCDVGEGSFF
jgi:hypothetical protein